MESENLFNLIPPDRYFIFENDIIQWPDLFEEVFLEVCRISNNNIKFISLDQTILGERKVKYLLIVEDNSQNELHLEIILEHTTTFNTESLANQLNSYLIKYGLTNHEYYFDITVDSGYGGLAFSDFETERTLFENGTLYRGVNEYENSENFQYFWLKLNEYSKNNSFSEVKEPKITLEQQAEDWKNHIQEMREFVKNNNNKEKVKHPWWKIWKK